MHTLVTDKRPSTLITDAFPQHPPRPGDFCRRSPLLLLGTRCLRGGLQPERAAGRVPDSSQMGQSSKVGQLGEAALPARPHCPLFFGEPQRGRTRGAQHHAGGFPWHFPANPSQRLPHSRPLRACCCLSPSCSARPSLPPSLPPAFPPSWRMSSRWGWKLRAGIH